MSFDSLPLMLLLILSGGCGSNNCGTSNSCSNNSGTLAMCLCLLLLCGDNCGCDPTPVL